MSEALTIHYPAELPVSQRREELARVIRDNQVVIVAGETGSGKTTQLPKICLELGRERIAHTQPRRIAARSVAERIAEELGVELGGIVGYQVRFDDRANADTRVKLMTDGVLLAELNRDRDLRRYDTIIIDEAHERSLTIDFLLGYLKQLLPRRPELRVIVTSATIDPQSFAQHFADASGVPAPIIEVSGRTYPVEVRYRALVADAVEADEDDEVPTTVGTDRDYLQGITDGLDELAREEPGDVLVFLTGENEIRDAEEAIRGRVASGSTGSVWAGTEVLPLYGRLSAADQHRVFDTKRAQGIRRRVVLATNVAETSLTVPGIKYVIDAGTARISRYSARAKVQRLPIEAISQASANQRSGRAGRTSAGIAIRLYSEDDYARRPEFTDPEILRTNLAAVILQMIDLKLGDIQQFPFLQPPDRRGVADGLDLLKELGAIDRDSHITKVGRDVARLPLDPRFGRMLVEAKRHGVVREVAAIVAGLTIQDPRERPLERRAQADQSHARFADPTSDFLSLLGLWNHLEAKQKELSGSAFRRLCKAEYLNYLRVREWQDLFRQLVRAGKRLDLVAGDPKVDPDAIHKSLLAGLLSRIGLYDREKRDYLGARQQRFVVFPGSGLAKKTPVAVMAAELVETSRLFARMVAAIDPAWAEALAGDLAKRSYSDPHWEKKQGSAVALERITLFGLPIVVRRRVQLARVDPVEARELFLRHALVDGDWPYEIARNELYEFDRANRALRRELGEVEERTRRRDILSDDEAIVEFYHRQIPGDVSDVRRFERWWKTAKVESPGLLTMSRADLLDEPDVAAEADQFPDSWVQGEQRLTLRYRFEPGAADDGVTAEVPIAVLARLDPAGFDWLVPGLREELVTALLKTLPKAIRRNVVPAADWARRLLAELPPPSETPLTEVLATAIRAATHVVIAPSDFEVERLPSHLRMTFAAVDERGRQLASSKDLAELQARLAVKSRETVARVTAPARVADPIERTGLTSWSLDELPRVLESRHAGATVRGFPALVDEPAGGGKSVAIRVFDTPAEQEREHRRGVRRLLALTVPSPLGYVQEHLTGTEKLQLATSPYPTTQALLDDALLAVIDEAAGDRAPFTAAEFEALRAEVSAGLVEALFDAVGATARVLGAARETDRAIRAASHISLISPLADARAQLESLIHPGFIRIGGVARLRRVPVYLAGIDFRVSKLAENAGRDRVWQTEVEQASDLFEAAGGTLPLILGLPPTLVEVRWMLEELRLSLFAQHLGAVGPVSVQRIRKALASSP